MAEAAAALAPEIAPEVALALPLALPPEDALAAAPLPETDLPPETVPDLDPGPGPDLPLPRLRLRLRLRLIPPLPRWMDG